MKSSVSSIPSSLNSLGKVLVVDDEGANRYAVGKTLARVGYEVSEANSAENALIVLENETVDVVISDIRMSGLSGIELLKIIKSKPQLRHIQVILMTGYASYGVALEGLRHNVFDFLIKPSSSQDIKESIHRAMVSVQQLKTKPPSEEQILNVGIDDTPALLPHILVVGKTSLTSLLIEELGDFGYEVDQLPTGKAALLFLEEFHPKTIIVDLSSSNDDTQKELWNCLIQLSSQAQTIVVTNVPSLGVAVGAIRSKISDYLIYDSNDINQLLKLSKQILLNAQESSGSNVIYIAEPPLNKSYIGRLQGALLNKGYVLNMCRARDFQKTIAEYNPIAILVDKKLPLSLLPQLRDFALSEEVPLIVVNNGKLAKLAKLYKAGADEAVGEWGYMALNAVTSVSARYSTPLLAEIGVAWNVLIVTGKAEIHETLTDYIQSTFFAETHPVTSIQSCLEIARNLDPDLLIIDTNLTDDLIPMVQQLRNVCKSPILLLASHLDDEVEEQRFALGIHGYIHHNFQKDNLVDAIQRLLRWRRDTKKLLEIWAQYAIQHREAEYEYVTRRFNRSTAAQIVEIGALYGGLIHDLRNSIYSINSQIKILQRNRKGEVDNSTFDELSLLLQYAEFLLETIANIRFKGTWRPKEQPLSVQLLESSLALARLAVPQTTFAVDLPEQKSPLCMIDEKQISHVLTSLFILLGNESDSVKLEVEKVGLYSAAVQLRIHSSDHKLKQLKKLLASKNNNLLSLNINKLTKRCGGAILIGDDSLRLTIPSHQDWQENAVRLQVAELAKRYDSVNRWLRKLKPLSESEPVATLVKPIAEKLFAQLEHIMLLCQQIGEDANRLTITARFGVLLARNLLVTSVDFKPKPETLSLELLFEHVLQLRKDFLRECEVAMRVEPDTPSVLADELGLLQVLVNLVTNAVEAMSGEGQLTLSAKPHPNGVQIIVADNGHGISPENLERIFDLSFTTKGGHERGVGLHIVSSVVRELNGKLEVQSTLGVGTTFTITLPSANVRTS